MQKPVTVLATELVAAGPGALEELQIHVFGDDASAYDDAAVQGLHASFTAEMNVAVTELNRIFGDPVRSGTSEDVAIPLGGVFSFAVWDIDGTELFIAAAHEDREVPIILMLGTA